MTEMQNIKTSLILSLASQLSIGVLNGYALSWTIDAEKGQGAILQTLLWIEFHVQNVEFIFYLFLTFLFYQEPKVFRKFAMGIRYLDWMITTPTMLLTLMVFMSGCTSLSTYWNRYSRITIFVFILDWLMLLCGFLHEHLSLQKTKCPSSKDYIYYGFFPFFLMFAVIYHTFHTQTEKSSKVQFIFFWFLILWTIYGVAAFFSFSVRNTIYNVIDIFSKNITSIFLVYLLSFYRKT